MSERQESTEGITQMHKIYAFNNGGSPGWLHAVALGDDGRVVAGHICSHESFMRHDLGVSGSNWKHEQYDKYYGAGNWSIEWVDDPDTHEGLKAAIELNKAQPPPPDDEVPGATFVTSDAEGNEHTHRVGP